jgi:hypothetical protein
MEQPRYSGRHCTTDFHQLAEISYDFRILVYWWFLPDNFLEIEGYTLCGELLEFIVSCFG